MDDHYQRQSVTMDKRYFLIPLLFAAGAIYTSQNTGQKVNTVNSTTELSTLRETLRGIGQTNWGDYWYFQDYTAGQFMIGFKPRYESPCGSSCDDTALNDIKIYTNDIRYSSEHEVEIDHSYRNYGDWGDWKKKQMCPTGQFVTSIRVQGEKSQGGGDDSGMNGIELCCRTLDWAKGKGDPNKWKSVQFKGDYGEWTGWTTEEAGKFVSQVGLQIEENQGGDKDDTALNRLDVILKKFDRDW